MSITFNEERDSEYTLTNNEFLTYSESLSTTERMSPPTAFDFTGEVAIVTGAGSRMNGKHGFGLAII